MIDTGMSLDFNSLGYKKENEVFLLLLQNGANPNLPDEGSLWKASQYNDIPKVKMLLSYNANAGSSLYKYLNLRTRGTISPVVAKYLLRYYVQMKDDGKLTNRNGLYDLYGMEYMINQNPELGKWIKENTRRIIKYFEVLPTDIPEYAAENHTTYFMFSASRGYIGVMRWYLSTVSNPATLINQLDIYGNNALHYAISDYEKHEDPYVITFLIENGGDLYQRNTTAKKTPLDLLSETNYFDDPELREIAIIGNERVNPQSLVSYLPKDITQQIQGLIVNK
jgi:ankyrin repeat protein